MNVQTLLDADALFGWPIKSIDELLALKQLAHTDAISLADWRSRDRELRKQLPLLSDEDQKALAAVSDEIISSRAFRDKAGMTLFERLNAIASPAPDNATLREELASLARMLQKGHIRNHAVLNQERERVTRWLRESSDDRDPLTMLPWVVVARFRIFDDSTLGPIPQSLAAARKRAVEHATEEELTEARSMGGGRVDDFTAAMSDVRDSTLTRFPNLILNSGTGDANSVERSRMMHALWNDPSTQQLLRQETASGWPPEYR